jgi:hypothetical protein
LNVRNPKLLTAAARDVQGVLEMRSRFGKAAVVEE